MATTEGDVFANGGEYYYWLNNSGAGESSESKRKRPEAMSGLEGGDTGFLNTNEWAPNVHLYGQEQEHVANIETAAPPPKRPRGRQNNPPKPKAPPRKRKKPLKYSDEAIEALKEDARRQSALRNQTARNTPLFPNFQGYFQPPGPPHGNLVHDSYASTNGHNTEQDTERVFEMYQSTAPSQEKLGEETYVSAFNMDVPSTTLGYEAEETTATLQQLRERFEPATLLGSEDEDQLRRHLELTYGRVKMESLARHYQ